MTDNSSLVKDFIDRGWKIDIIFNETIAYLPKKQYFSITYKKPILNLESYLTERYASFSFEDQVAILNSYASSEDPCYPAIVKMFCNIGFNYQKRIKNNFKKYFTLKDYVRNNLLQILIPKLSSRICLAKPYHFLFNYNARCNYVLDDRKGDLKYISNYWNRQLLNNQDLFQIWNNLLARVDLGQKIHFKNSIEYTSKSKYQKLKRYWHNIAKRYDFVPPDFSRNRNHIQISGSICDITGPDLSSRIVKKRLSPSQFRFEDNFLICKSHNMEYRFNIHTYKNNLFSQIYQTFKKYERNLSSLKIDHIRGRKFKLYFYLISDPVMNISPVPPIYQLPQHNSVDQRAELRVR